MLVLTRRKHQSIIIGGGITVKILSSSDGRVKIGINAPPGVTVDREEVHQRKANEQATSDPGNPAQSVE